MLFRSHRLGRRLRNVPSWTFGTGAYEQKLLRLPLAQFHDQAQNEVHFLRPTQTRRSAIPPPEKSYIVLHVFGGDVKRFEGGIASPGLSPKFALVLPRVPQSHAVAPVLKGAQSLARRSSPSVGGRILGSE